MSDTSTQDIPGPPRRQLAFGKYAFVGSIWAEPSKEETKALVHFCGEFTGSHLYTLPIDP
jgi:hypothetical protein